MKKVFSVVFILVTAGLLTALIFSDSSITQNNPAPTESPSYILIAPSSSSSVSNDTSDTPTFPHSNISLSFDFGTEKKSFEISSDGQENLFELIQKTDLKIETENFPPIGKMIVSINGLKNGTDGKYWQFWINDKYAQIGASAYIPQPNDSVEWKFTKEKPN